MSNNDEEPPPTSEAIKNLLADIDDNDGKIDIIEEKIEADIQGQKDLNKTLKKKKKKRKLIIKDNKLQKELEEAQKEKKKMRKQLAKLEKQAGKQTNKVAGKGSSAKAKGTGGGNPKGVRCFIRYNNAGNPYRICSDNKGKKPQKPKSVITEAIDPSEFAEKFGGYANLSDEQTATYHRLWMRKNRKEQAQIEEGGEQAVKIFQAEKQKAKEEKRLKKLEKEAEKLEKKQNREKFKAEVSKLVGNFVGKKEQIEKLREKYGVKKNVAKQVKQNVSDVAEAESNIKTLEETIKDGKKKVSQSLKVTSKKNVKMTF
jgi:chromosome segregation ATPase